MSKNNCQKCEKIKKKAFKNCLDKYLKYNHWFKNHGIYLLKEHYRCIFDENIIKERISCNKKEQECPLKKCNHDINFG